MRLHDLHEAPAKRKLFTTRSEIEKWLKKDDVHSFKIHDDLSVDVFSDNNVGCQLTGSSYPYLPVDFNFCESFLVLPPTLTTLEGAPRRVSDLATIYANNLHTLAGCPQEAESDITIRNAAHLKNLKGGPRIVRDSFYVSRNNFDTLIGLPEEIHVLFECDISHPLPVLDVLNVKHLPAVQLNVIDSSWKKVQDILNTFLKMPYGNKRIIDCQSALIDAGFEDWAEFGEDV
jgi:hypothetical protein